MPHACLFSAGTVTVVCLQGERGCEQLVIENYMYLKDRTSGPKTFWKCHMYAPGKCRCRCITTDDGRLVALRGRLTHPHPPNFRKLQFKPILYRRTFQICEMDKSTLNLYLMKLKVPFKYESM